MDEPIGAALAAELGADLPITVGNVADVAAFAEHARGVAAGCDNVIYLYGDVGVGAGIIAGGRRLTGHGGYGGEVGHMVVVRDGTGCECGSRGCWETEIGEYGLLRAAGRSDARGRDALLAVFDAADRGDARAQTAVRQAGDWLGFGVANLVNIFNPEMVIFGGTMRDLYLAAAAQVRSRLNAIGAARLPGTRPAAYPQARRRRGADRRGRAGLRTAPRRPARRHLSRCRTVSRRRVAAGRSRLRCLRRPAPAALSRPGLRRPAS